MPVKQIAENIRKAKTSKYWQQTSKAVRGGMINAMNANLVDEISSDVADTICAAVVLAMPNIARATSEQLKCMGCGLVAVVNGVCTECGARTEQ